MSSIGAVPNSRSRRLWLAARQLDPPGRFYALSPHTSFTAGLMNLGQVRRTWVTRIDDSTRIISSICVGVLGQSISTDSSTSDRKMNSVALCSVSLLTSYSF